MVVCCHSLDVRVRALSDKCAKERWRTHWLHGVAIRVVMCRYARRRKKRQARKMTGELDHNCRGTGLVAALGVQVYHCWKGEDASVRKNRKLTHAKAVVTRCTHRIHFPCPSGTQIPLRARIRDGPGPHIVEIQHSSSLPHTPAHARSRSLMRTCTQQQTWRKSREARATKAGSHPNHGSMCRPDHMHPRHLIAIDCTLIRA